jgi:hypothetical protein
MDEDDLKKALKETITQGRNRSIKVSLVTDDDDDYALIIEL